ncbi:class I SAM-dependent methyltransferase [Glycomyces sp. NRRL B-16210]|uniref:class I SAM-dependent methyltransferase n=1 Tax=Glycomyces sp. NRRL B-16210 TaxID=1463821 RepID=UPI0004C13C18|nr:class I SAM-dependent methyltransferase [Glycomyces sp. NRRL B-16210]
MSEVSPVARFYDQLTPDYHLVYADWEQSMERQGKVLDAMIRAGLGMERAAVLDCSCGIGTQAIALGRRGHRVTGTDISVAALARAAREALGRGVPLALAAADMRALPFADGAFDAVVSADNSLPHLLTEEDVRAALSQMRRVLRVGGLLVVSVRDYDAILRSRPASTPPQTSALERGRAVTFQLWDWHSDGERYDLEHFQLVPDGSDWTVEVRRTSYWALTRRRLTGFVLEAGFAEPQWRAAARNGFFQPVLTARAV